MPSKTDLQSLVRDNPLLWQGKSRLTTTPGISTGFAELDAILPGQGWPPNAIVELLVPHDGMGELQLVLPVLKRLQPLQSTWVAPPYIPNAPELINRDIDLEKLLILNTENHTDTLWAAEKLFQNESTGSVLFWADGIRPQQLRRLQLSAQAGNTLGFLFSKTNQANSPAAVRLQLQASETGLRVYVLKAKGSSRRDYCQINLAGTPAQANTVTASSFL